MDGQHAQRKKKKETSDIDKDQLPRPESKSEPGSGSGSYSGERQVTVDTFFATELGRIQFEPLRAVARSCLEAYLDELIKTPASRRFHPPDERGRFGAIIHFKRVAWFCKCIEEELHLPVGDMDVLYAAALLHDLAKIKIYSIKNDTVHADEDAMSIHPLISAQMAAPFLDTLEPELQTRIMALIKTHMGFWYRKCPPPETELERLFCMADYIVSRVECVIDVGFSHN